MNIVKTLGRWFGLYDYEAPEQVKRPLISPKPNLYLTHAEREFNHLYSRDVDEEKIEIRTIVVEALNIYNELTIREDNLARNIISRISNTDLFLVIDEFMEEIVLNDKDDILDDDELNVVVTIRRIFEMILRRHNSNYVKVECLKFLKRSLDLELFFPLTGEDTEWEELEPRFFQNKRYRSVFKKNGKVYDINKYTLWFWNKGTDGTRYKFRFIGRRSQGKIDFPYVPEKKLRHYHIGLQILDKIAFNKTIWQYKIRNVFVSK